MRYLFRDILARYKFMTTFILNKCVTQSLETVTSPHLESTGIPEDTKDEKMLPPAVRMNDTQQGQNIEGTIKSGHSDVTGLAKILALTLQEECRTKDECRTTEPAAFVSPVSLLTHGNSPKPGMGQPSHKNAQKESAIR
jgi:hypothetical protein